MSVSNEIVLQQRDLRISISCQHCKARFEASPYLLKLPPDSSEQSKKRDIPNRCPSCDVDWSKVRGILTRFFEVSRELEPFNINFHVTLTEPKETA